MLSGLYVVKDYYHSNSKNMVNFPIFHKDNFIKHKPLNFWRVTSFRSCFSLFFTHNFGSSGYRMHDWEYMWIRLRPIFDDGCNFQTRLLLLGMKKENAAKGSFFWDLKSGHEFKEFPAKKPGLWLVDLSGLPIRGSVWGGKPIELMSWLQISEKPAFSSHLCRLIGKLFDVQKSLILPTILDAFKTFISI